MSPQARTRSRWRRRLGCVGVLLLMAALGLVVTEAVMRARTAHVLGPIGELRGMVERDGRGGLRTVPGWRGEHTVEGRTHTIRLNELGLRGADVGDKAGPRVLVMGDSMVFGAGVDDDQPFTAALQRRLAAGGGGAPVQVGNGGVPGFGSVDQANALGRFLESFDPEVVVACVYLGNDFHDDAVLYRTVVDGYVLRGPVGRMAEDSFRVRVALRLRTAWIVEQVVEKYYPAHSIDIRGKSWSTPDDIESERLLPPEHRAAFGVFMDVIQDSPVTRKVMANLSASLSRIRHQAGTRPVLVMILPTWAHVVPGEWEAVLKRQGRAPDEHRAGMAQQRIRQVCERLGLAVLDLTPLMQADANPARLFLREDRHFSPEGHEQIATWLEPRVVELLDPAPDGR